MIYDFEEFVNEGVKRDFVIIDTDSEYEEGMEFINKLGDGTKVDETEIQKIWKKMKGDKQKFAEAVFAQYPDVFEIRHTVSSNEDTGEYIDRELGKWSGYFC